jgi:hypothetical protein
MGNKFRKRAVLDSLSGMVDISLPNRVLLLFFLPVEKPIGEGLGSRVEAG